MTAPRWQDVVIPLVRNERARLEEHLAWTRQLPVTTETERAFRDHEIVRIEARIAPLDAALARLAEPAQSSAAERWRAVPERARAAKLSELSDDVTIYSASPDCDTDGIPYADHAEASRALLALARDAEGT